MKKKMVTRIALLMLCLCLGLPAAVAETREGVIYLEGMAETIEETLFESPEGFSFWYASEGLAADFGKVDDREGVVVSNIYTDDYMLLAPISEEEALEYTKDLEENIVEQSAESRVQVDVYLELNLEEGMFHFCSLIADGGTYLLAVGEYSMEAADGTGKYFQRVLDTVAWIDAPTEIVAPAVGE